MSSSEKHYNNGVCPNCGNISGSTIASTENAIYREITVYEPKWWQLFKKRDYYIQAKDEHSYRLLNKAFS